MSKVITDNTMSAIVALMNNDTREAAHQKWHHAQIVNFSRNTVNRNHRLRMFLKTNLALNYKGRHYGT